MSYFKIVNLIFLSVSNRTSVRAVNGKIFSFFLDFWNYQVTYFVPVPLEVEVEAFLK